METMGNNQTTEDFLIPFSCCQTSSGAESRSQSVTVATSFNSFVISQRALGPMNPQEIDSIICVCFACAHTTCIRKRNPDHHINHHLPPGKWHYYRHGNSEGTFCIKKGMHKKNSQTIVHICYATKLWKEMNVRKITLSITLAGEMAHSVWFFAVVAVALTLHSAGTGVSFTQLHVK